MKKVTVLPFLVSVVISLQSSIAMAGVGAGGGGSSIGNQFFDSALAGNRFDPKTLPSFKSNVLPILKKVEGLSPLFAMHLDEASNGRGGCGDDREWYFVDQLPNLPSDQTGIPIPVQTAAFQTQKGDIYVLKSWFQKASPRDQGALLLHEMIQALRLVNGPLCYYGKGRPYGREESISPDSVWRLTVGLLDGTLLQEDVLKKALVDYGFGWYLTMGDMKTASQAWKDGQFTQKITQICQNSEASDKSIEKTLDELGIEFQRDGFAKEYDAGSIILNIFFGWNKRQMCLQGPPSAHFLNFYMESHVNY